MILPILFLLESPEPFSRLRMSLIMTECRRALDDEIEGAVGVDGDFDADNLALERGGLGVEALDELAGVDAVGAEGGADRGCRGGGAAGGLHF